MIVGRHGGARRVPGRRRKRHSDGAGGLLYVGLTCDITGRLTKHAGDKDWWVDVARVELEHFGSREEAGQREATLIRDLQPQYNLAFIDRHDACARCDAPTVGGARLCESCSSFHARAKRRPQRA